MTAMHPLSENPQQTIEELVPVVVAALLSPMTSRELATSIDLSSTTIGNVLRLAGNFGLTRKVPTYSKRATIWTRTEGDTYTTAWSAWENRSQKPRRPSKPSSRLAASPSQNLNADFWSRWLRNDPSTRPKLDD
jgi:hypothetical protein